MACRKNRKTIKGEKYLSEVFSMLKKRENLLLTDKKTHFNDTELRLLGEILEAKYQKKDRLISTQLALRLGVTRSAISQIVNRLEAEGVIRRVPDDRDKKIAYIEVREEILEQYEEDIKVCADFITGVVEEFGVERFEQMSALLHEFMDAIEKAKKEVKIS